MELAVRSVLEPHNYAVELLISDGGSTDGTLALLEKLLIEFGPRLSWVSAADGGPANAINGALRRARGDIIGWLNADDIYSPDAIAVAIRSFAADAELVMFYGEAEHVNAIGSSLYRYPTQPPSAGINAFQSGCFICQPTVFLRRYVWDQLGGLDENLSTAFDYDFWLRVFCKFPGRIGYTERVQAFSRLHGRTITSLQRKSVASEAVRLLARHLGSARSHWILTYVNEVTRAYPAYEMSWDLRRHVLAMVADLTSCFDEIALSHLRSVLDQDLRLTVVPAGVHADMCPDGWAGPYLRLRIRSARCGSLSLVLQCEATMPGDGFFDVRILTSGGTDQSLPIGRRGPFEIAIAFPDVTLGQLLFVEVHSNANFIPSLIEEGSTDNRELAYRIMGIRTTP